MPCLLYPCDGLADEEVVARYLVGLLHSRTPSFFEQHHPVSFSTIATPVSLILLVLIARRRAEEQHLGIPKYSMSDVTRCVKELNRRYIPIDITSLARIEITLEIWGTALCDGPIFG